MKVKIIKGKIDPESSAIVEEDETEQGLEYRLNQFLGKLKANGSVVKDIKIIPLQGDLLGMVMYE